MSHEKTKKSYETVGVRDAEKDSEMTKRGKDTEIPGIKNEPPKMSVYGPYAAIIIE